MARYAAAGQQNALTTTFKTALTQHAPGASPRRSKLYDFTIGTPDAPADNALIFQIIRTTANGTETAVVAAPLDPADAAASTTCGKNATIEPTTSGLPLILFGLNQRATYRWVAAPGGELIIPATINAGLALQFESPAYVGAANGSLAFEE